jgi:hypothetical protein
VAANQMRPFRVNAGPPPISYSSFEAAVDGAKRHPTQAYAQRCADLLAGDTRVTGGTWYRTQCVVSFSNGRVLRVSAGGFALHWEVLEQAEPPAGRPYKPIELIWNTELRAPFDPVALLAQITGSQFVDLFVNELGLLLYTSGNPILWFHAVQLSASNRDLLFAAFE